MTCVRFCPCTHRRDHRIDAHNWWQSVMKSLNWFEEIFDKMFNWVIIGKTRCKTATCILRNCRQTCIDLSAVKRIRIKRNQVSGIHLLFEQHWSYLTICCYEIIVIIVIFILIGLLSNA